jgi:hypothetical protein
MERIVGLWISLLLVATEVIAEPQRGLRWKPMVNSVSYDLIHRFQETPFSGGKNWRTNGQLTPTEGSPKHHQDRSLAKAYESA